MFYKEKENISICKSLLFWVVFFVIEGKGKEKLTN